MATSRLERIGTIFTRKKIYNNYQKNLLEVRHILEADYNISKDNEQKFEKLIGVFLKSMQQTTNAQKDHIETISQISESFKKEVEGLLTRGAMKPDDRPLWFDVYRALPPITEPKFARPKPEKKPIRPILYKEDIIRAKFHANSNGLSSNMLSPGGETHTRRLVQQYIKLESKGVPESKLIEKSVAAVSSERQLESKIMSKNPDSVTSQVLVEADLKNIFKE